MGWASVLVGVCVATAGPRPGDGSGGHVRILSDHAEVAVGVERYRLVAPQGPLRAVVRDATKQERLVVEVVRLGRAGQTLRGGTPLVVHVGKKKHVFPNRPALVRDRAAVMHRTDALIASYPVRYRLPLPRRGQVPVRIALKVRDDARVGVRVYLEDPERSLLTPLSFNKHSRAKSKVALGRKRSRRRRGPYARMRAGQGVVDEGRRTARANPDGGPARPVHTARDGGAADAGGATARVDGGAGPGDGGTGQGQRAASRQAPGEPLGVRVVLVFDDQLGGVFKLMERQAEIDGQLVHFADADALGGHRAVMFDGTLPEGLYTFDVALTYAGDGGLFFSYLDAYRFHVRERFDVLVDGQGTLEVLVTGRDQGGWFSEIEERPALSVETRRVP